MCRVFCTNAKHLRKSTLWKCQVKVIGVRQCLLWIFIFYLWSKASEHIQFWSFISIIYLSGNPKFSRLSRAEFRGSISTAYPPRTSEFWTWCTHYTVLVFVLLKSLFLYMLVGAQSLAKLACGERYSRR